MCATRRSFLGKATAAAIVTATSRDIWAQRDQADLETSREIGRQTMATATPQMFEQWIGGTFKVSLGATSLGTVELVKVEAEMYPHLKTSQPIEVSPDQRIAAPSLGVGTTGATAGTVPEVRVALLWFRRRGKPLSQAVYTMEHDWLGSFNMLIAPSRVRTGWTYCFAVVSHFTGRMVPQS